MEGANRLRSDTHRNVWVPLAMRLPSFEVTDWMSAALLEQLDDRHAMAAPKLDVLV
jgi:hypothetical protein